MVKEYEAHEDAVSSLIYLPSGITWSGSWDDQLIAWDANIMKNDNVQHID